MPRRQALDQIIPNRFYQIDATLKYQHIGQNTITGIIEQNSIQTKICIPKDGIQLEEGKQYTFGNCFNSRNGWLYARNPSQTVLQRSQSSPNANFSSLNILFQRRESWVNHYVSTRLRVIQVQSRQNFPKKNQNHNSYKLRCFADSLMVEVQVWNHELNSEEVVGKVLDFVGFKIKCTSHQTVTLVSTVYSKIQVCAQPLDLRSYRKQENQLYRNISSIFQLRKVDQIHKTCELIHKNYSISKVKINFIEKLSYQGCNKCKRKLGQNGCFQCGPIINRQNYQYLRAVLQDQTGIIECAIFDQNYQQIAENLLQKKAIFKIKSAVKRNHQTRQIFSSHVVTEIRNFVITQ